MSADTARPPIGRAAGFADSRRLMPIGGEVPGEIGAIDRTLVLVANQAAALDGATRGGMWRTWKLEALVDAENEARAAFTRALASLPADRADLRALVEERRVGLEAFLARYPGRRG